MFLQGPDGSLLEVYLPRNSFHFIIPNSAKTHVLVSHPSNTDPTLTILHLPFVSPPTDDENIPHVLHWNAQAFELCSVTHHFLNLRVYIRDLIWRNPDLSSDCEENILLAELVESDIIPSTFYWATVKQVNENIWQKIHSQVHIPRLISKVLSVSRSNEISADGVEWTAYGNSPLQPWRQQGWFHETERWFKDTMCKQSIRLHTGGRLTQLVNMQQSTVLHYPLETATESELSELASYNLSPERYVFLKCSIGGFPEAAITKAIASHLPEFVPEVLSTKDEYTFVQAGAASLPCVSWAKILEALVHMQFRSLECIESLQAGGVPYHGLDWHVRHLAEVLKNPAFKVLQSNQAYLKLSDHVGHLRAMFAELNAYQIPQTLVHGDFVSANIMTCPGTRSNLRFIDWATSCIGHPFIDFLRFVFIDDYGDVDDNARNDYLSNWEKFESKENIVRAVSLAYPVMLWENVHVLLGMYKCAGSTEKEYILSTLEERLHGILYRLQARFGSRVNSLDKSDGASLLVIARDCGNQVLARRSGQALSLPCVTACNVSQFVLTDRQLDGRGMRVMIRSQLGVETRIIRKLWIQMDDAVLRKKAIVLEVLDEVQAIPYDCEWVGPNAADHFMNGVTDERAVVNTYFRETSEHFGANEHTLQPWCQFGWLKRTCDWADDVLLQHGLRRTGVLHEVKTDLFATVWKSNVNLREGSQFRLVCHNTGCIFVKAGLINRFEGNVISVISKFANEAVPSVIGVDPKSHTFIMTDMEPVGNGEIDWCLLFGTLGDIQNRSIEYADELVRAGLPIRDCDWVQSNLEELENKCRDILGLPDGPSPSFNACDISFYMAELKSFNLPLSLVHGDFHLGNIGNKRNAGYGVFDWSSAYIGIPLCDVAVMIKLSGNSFSSHDSSLESYLSSWGDKFVGLNLDRAIDLSLVYYWVLDIESFLNLLPEVPVPDRATVRNMISDSFRCLETAVLHVRQSPNKIEDVV